MIKSKAVARCLTELREYHGYDDWSCKTIFLILCFCEDIRDDDLTLIMKSIDAFEMGDQELVIAVAILAKYMSVVEVPAVCIREAWIGCVIVACKLHTDDEICFFNERACAIFSTTSSFFSSAELRVLTALRWNLPIDDSIYLSVYRVLTRKSPTMFHFLRTVLLQSPAQWS